MKEKIYKIKHTPTRGNDFIVQGTLSYLINYYSYDLLIGNSHNKKISVNPRTIKSFISCLQKSYYIIESGCYNRTSIELIK